MCVKSFERAGKAKRNKKFNLRAERKQNKKVRAARNRCLSRIKPHICSQPTTTTSGNCSQTGKIINFIAILFYFPFRQHKNCSIYAVVGAFF